MAARRGEAHFFAAGAEAGEASLSVNVAAPTSSTMFDYAPEHQAEIDRAA